MKFKVQDIDIPNKNGRIYSAPVLQRAIEKFNTIYIKENRAFLCGHRPGLEEYSLSDIIGMVRFIGIENNKVMADVEKLNINDMEELWGLLEQDKLSIRMSGVGTLIRQLDGNYFVEDYELERLIVTNDPA